MTITEIEKAIADLPLDQYVILMSRLVEQYADVWDDHIDSDLKSGRLDVVLAQVDEECEAGLAKPI